MEIVLFKIRTRADIDQDEYERTFAEMLDENVLTSISESV